MTAAALEPERLADAIEHARRLEGDTFLIDGETLRQASRFIRNHSKPPAEVAGIDEIMTRVYRRFKEWSQRKFSADDVTWCEVRADIMAILLSLSRAEAVDAGLEMAIAAMKSELTKVQGDKPIVGEVGILVVTGCEEFAALVEAAIRALKSTTPDGRKG